MAYDDYQGILSELLAPQQGVLSNPRDMALMQLGLGLLAQSGPQPRKVGLGEAFGKAGIPALGAYQNMQQDQRRERMTQFEMLRRIKQQELEEQYRQAQMENMRSQTGLRTFQEMQKMAAAERQAQAEKDRQAALGNLQGILALPNEQDALAQMIEMEKRGEQGSVRAQTPEAVRRASLAYDPTGAQLGRLAQAERPTLLTPGMGVLRPGEAQPGYTQPFAPRPEPRPQRPVAVIGADGQPELVPPEQAYGRKPVPSPGAKRSEDEQQQKQDMASYAETLIKRLENSLKNDPRSTTGIFSPVVRGYEAVVNSIEPGLSGSQATTASQTKEQLITVLNRIQGGGAGRLSNQDMMRVDTAIGKLNTGTPDAMAQGLRDARSLINSLMGRRSGATEEWNVDAGTTKPIGNGEWSIRRVR